MGSAERQEPRFFLIHLWTMEFNAVIDPNNFSQQYQLEFYFKSPYDRKDSNILIIVTPNCLLVAKFSH